MKKKQKSNRYKKYKNGNWLLKEQLKELNEGEKMNNNIKNWVEIQKQKQFENKLKEKVNQEDWVRWSKAKDYIDLMEEKLTKGKTEEEIEFIVDKLFLGIIIFVCFIIFWVMFSINKNFSRIQNQTIEQVIPLKK